MKQINTAMILAAGRGERMRPLTDITPKPLLEVKGKALIEYHLERLAVAGIERVVINHAWLGEQLIQRLGDGRQYNLDILYSKEEAALETAGGIIRALPLLCPNHKESHFLVINGDIFTDFSFADMLASDPLKIACQGNTSSLAHLILVPNPPHNINGDFYVQDQHILKQVPESINATKYTFSGIGIYSSALFNHLPQGNLRLAPVLIDAMAKGRVTGALYEGTWIDIGTPQRLAQLN
tara:strand:+ start:45738 stop:46451 length:714 start_codon:yes stop_codon:yes gene_type:complete